DAAIAKLSEKLGVDPTDSLEKIEADYFAGSIIAPEQWPALAKILAQGGKSDGEQADRFARLATLSGAERVDAYLDIFLTSGARTPRKSIVSKAISDRALVERLCAEQDRVCALLERYRA